ncbi:MAG: hypothetical protein ACTSWX_11245 [Promethearchaeota archaeon]
MKVEENWSKIKIGSVILFFPIFGILAFVMFKITPLKQDIFVSANPLLIQVIVFFIASLSMLLGLFYLIQLPKKFENLKKMEISEKEK